MQTYLRPKTLVIVVNYNSQHILNVVTDCIKSIVEQIRKMPNTHLLLIDNGSSDNSLKEMINLLSTKTYRKVKRQILLLRFARNVGFAKACQIGFDNFGVRYDFIVIINNDLIINDSSLSHLISILRKYPTIAAVQGIITRLNKEELDSAGVLLGPLLGMYPLDLFHLAVRGNLVQVSYVDGAFLCVKSSILKELENVLFFEELMMYLEDLELGIRLQRAGYSVYLVKWVVGSHYRSASWLRLKDELRNYLVTRNLIAVIGAHFGTVGLFLAIIRGILINFLSRKKLIYYSVKHGIKLRRQILMRTKNLSLHCRPYTSLSAELHSLRKVASQFLHS